MKPDEFRVGDRVWCLLNGEGQVVDTGPSPWSDFNIKVQFKNAKEDEAWFYTNDGKLNTDQNRTLFFSEPKVEASVTRPFVPTLVGKRVVVVLKFDWTAPKILTVFKEDSERIYDSEEGHYWSKDNIDAIYEVSSENLLKP